MRRRNLLMSGGGGSVEGCLEFEVLSPTRFKFSGTSSNTLQYSINGNEWQDLANNTYTSALTQGDKIYFKGTCTPITNSPYGIGRFVSSGGTWNAKGTPMSLLYGDNFKGETSLEGKDCAFYGLFSGCIGLTSAENLSLPATTLANYCYAMMFNQCSSLRTAPSLPATTLASLCYNGMFNGCTNLTIAPTLPATTLANGCYYSMFSNTNVLPDCTNINFSSSTVVASGGLRGLFGGTKLTNSQLDTILKSHGINNYSLPCTTLVDGCYNYMFGDCTSLTTAPELPATTLAESCYLTMFIGCTNLTTAPILPATTLAYSCYSYMFAYCTNLSSITCLAFDISASQCTSNWVSGVASSGAFITPSSTDWAVGDSGIPSGWDRIDW